MRHQAKSRKKTPENRPSLDRGGQAFSPAPCEEVEEQVEKNKEKEVSFHAEVV